MLAAALAVLLILTSNHVSFASSNSGANMQPNIVKNVEPGNTQNIKLPRISDLRGVNYANPVLARAEVGPVPNLLKAPLQIKA